MLGAWPASLALTHMLGAWPASLALTHMLGAWPASLALTHMLGAWQASLALTHMLGAWQTSLALTHMLGAWQAYLALTLLSLDNKHLHVWRNKWHDCHYSLFQPPWQGDWRQRPALFRDRSRGVNVSTDISSGAATPPNPILHATHPPNPLATNPFIAPNMCILRTLKGQPHIPNIYTYIQTTRIADGWSTSGAQGVSAH